VNDSKFNAKIEIGEENLMARVTKGSREISNSKSSSDKIYLRRSGVAFCPVCGKLVELLSFDAAAELFNTNVQDIETLAQGGDLHRVHNRKGIVLICSDSLFKCINSRETMRLDPGFEAKVKKVFVRGESNERRGEKRDCY
jgi:hypothetical protein